MAWTVTRNKHNSGDMRMETILVVADSAEANLVTSMKLIEAFSVGKISFTTALNTTKANVDSSGTAANGKIGCSGFVSGDTCYFVVYGR